MSRPVPAGRPTAMAPLLRTMRRGPLRGNGNRFIRTCAPEPVGDATELCLYLVGACWRAIIQPASDLGDPFLYFHRHDLSSRPESRFRRVGREVYFGPALRSRLGRGAVHGGQVWVRKPAPADGGSGVVVSQVVPASGDSIGGKSATVSGSGFTGATTVSFGANAATNVSVVNDTTITCTTPAGTAGKVAVSVDGNTRDNAYIYRGGTYTRPTLVRNTPVDKYVWAAAPGGGDGSSGSPYTLAEAIAALANGQRLYLKGNFGAGSYIPFTGKGSATDGIIVTRWPGEASQPVLQGGPDDANDYPAAFINTGNYIVIEDIEINRTGGSSIGVDGRGGDNCQVVDCTLTDCHIKLGTTTTGCSNWYIKGNAIVGEAGAYSSNTGDGIWLQNGSNNNVIVENTIGNCGHSGFTISYQGAAESTCDDNVFAYNTITNNYSGSIILNGKANRTIVECNDAYDSGTTTTLQEVGSRASMQLQGTDNIVRYNRLWNAYTQGISLQAYTFGAFAQPCTGNHVHNNTIFGCGSMPIQLLARLGSAVDTTFANNVIENNLAWANHTVGASEAGGQFESVYYPIWVDFFNNAATYWTAPMNGNVIRNNLLARSSGTTDEWVLFVRVVDATNDKYTLAAFESAFSATAANNIEDVDPGLQDTATDKFWLNSDASAAVDAGFATVGVEYLGSAPDIGAFERA